MSAIVLAIGNPLRGDDGAAHLLADLLEAVPGVPPGIEVRCVHQLTPELAEAIASFATVVFADADPGVNEARIECLAADVPATSMTHSLAPAQLVAIAQRLYDFHGTAYVCRIPARDFTPGSALSPIAQAGARAAAELVSAHLRVVVVD